MGQIFGLSVVSNKRRSGSAKPEFTLTTSEGGIKINEAASKLLDIKSGDYLVFVTNHDQITRMIAQKHEDLVQWAEETGNDIADYPIFYGIAKGYPAKTSTGEVIMTKVPTSKKERERLIEEGHVDENGEPIIPEMPRMHGARMSSTNKIAGYGTLSGSDLTMWQTLNGSEEELTIFDVDIDTVETENEYGEKLVVYPLTNRRTKEKLVR